MNLSLSHVQMIPIFQVKDLHKFDCIRANKSMMAWGVEPRMPFLDREFLEYTMDLNPMLKMCGDWTEKRQLRLDRQCSQISGQNNDQRSSNAICIPSFAFVVDFTLRLDKFNMSLIGSDFSDH